MNEGDNNLVVVRNVNEQFAKPRLGKIKFILYSNVQREVDHQNGSFRHVNENRFERMSGIRLRSLNWRT